MESISPVSLCKSCKFYFANTGKEIGAAFRKEELSILINRIIQAARD